MSLILTLRRGQKINIGDASISLPKTGGPNNVTIRIDAPREISITRKSRETDESQATKTQNQKTNIGKETRNRTRKITASERNDRKQAAARYDD